MVLAVHEMRTDRQTTTTPQCLLFAFSNENLLTHRTVDDTNDARCLVCFHFIVPVIASNEGKLENGFYCCKTMEKKNSTD